MLMRSSSDVDTFITTLQAFTLSGQTSVTRVEGDIPYVVNEFWTAGQRQGHSLHELSYRACFKPQLPAFFIDRLTAPGDTVYDPFAGRGTTAIQAALIGRRPVSNDINPLATLLTRPRLTPPNLLAVAEALLRIDWRAGTIDRPDLLAFYGPSTLQQICALRTWLLTHAVGDQPPLAADWIRAVSLHLLSGHSPGFFSVRSMPPNQAISVRRN
jgi:DNA methylase